MQVKKFEAKTMKEALDLVKVHLGPEAIILSAKDSHRGFGLMGEKSVEVTAAVSDETLRKKKVAESKLREDLRERFQQIPATKQREFINRVFEERKVEKRELVTALTAEVRSELSGIRYADIQDEPQRSASQERVRRAAERARLASRDVFQDPPRKTPPVRKVTPQTPTDQRAQSQARQQPQPPSAVPHVSNNPEVRMLESQVRELKSLVERFQQIPQIPMSMHPGAEQGLPFELSPVYQRLTGQGIKAEIVSSLLKRAQRELDHDSLKKPALVEAWIVRQLLNSIDVSKDPMGARYHVFMGSTGQGKTTSLVKFASHLVLKEKKTIAIISLDTIKVGAADQLKIYAQILNVPFAIVRNGEEWRVAQQKLSRVQHILVDCPGFNLRSMEEVEWLKRLIPPPEMSRQIHYVQSVLARDEEAFDLASRYQMLGFNDVIFTRLDESSRQGLIVNFQQQFSKPLHSFGLGPRIPEDFEFATKERVIDFIFKLSFATRREG